MPSYLRVLCALRGKNTLRGKNLRVLCALRGKNTLRGINLRVLCALRGKKNSVVKKRSTVITPAS